MFSVKKILLLSALSCSFLTICPPPSSMQIESLEADARAERDPQIRKALEQRAAIMRSDATGTSAPIITPTKPVDRNTRGEEMSTKIPTSHPTKKATPTKKTGLVEQGKRLIQAAKNKMGFGPAANGGKKGK